MKMLMIEKSVLAYLESKKYTSVKPLGKRGFGDVLDAISPNKVNVALKIIPNEKSWEYEERIWPLFKHRNILPVLDILDVKELDCKIYVMPKEPFTLHRLVQSFDFKNDLNGLCRIKKWFVEILLALDYLHNAEFCHLDLKGDNVLISSDDSAIVCDFSGLNITGIKLERLCAPLKYRAPECFAENGNTVVEGVQFDMWSFGLLAFNVLTDYETFRKMDPVDEKWTWESGVMPVLTEGLQKANFLEQFEKAFPFVWLSEEQCDNALDFVRSLLNFAPEERPTAAQALKHPFLKFKDSVHREKDRGDYEGIFDESVLMHEIRPDENNNENICLGAVPKNIIPIVNISCQSSQEQCTRAEEKQESEQLDLDIDSVSTDLTKLHSNIFEVKEQNSKVALNVLAPSSPDLELDDISTVKDMRNDIITFQDDLFMPEFYNVDERKSSKTRSIRNVGKWFKKKFNQVFKRKANYAELVSDED